MMEKALILILLFTDFLFTTSLEVLRKYTGIFSGYELTFNFTYGFSENIYFHLMATFFTITISSIADNFTGKIYMTIFGLFFAVVSFVFPLLENYVEIPFSVLITSVLFSIYLGSSQARNLLILEQMDTVRFDIFFMVYLRLIGRGLFHWFNPKHYILSIVALAYSFCYFIIFIIIAKKFYIEPIYLKIFCKVLKCAYNAFKNRRKNERGTSKYDIRHKKSLEELVIKEPLPDIDVPYYKAILKEKEEQKTATPSIFEPPQEEEWTILGYIASFFPWTQTPEPPKRSVAVSRISVDKITTKSDGREEYVFDSENLGHWLFRAFPKSTYYIIFQGIRTENGLLYIYLGFLYTFLSTFITLSSIFLQTIALDFEIDVITFSIIFELLLFPIVELYLCPAICDYFNNKMGPFGIGHFCLIISGTVVLILHIVLVLTLPYIPEKDSVQIRIHNLLKTQASIYTKITGYKDINSRDYLGIYDIHDRGLEQITIKYEIAGVFYESVSNIELNNVSYFITEKGFFRTGEKDPSIFQHKGKTLVYALGENKNVPIVFEDQVEPNKEVGIVLKDLFEIENGIYKVTGSSYNLKKGCLYAVLLGGSESSVEVLGVDKVEGPILISSDHVLIFVFLKSVANTFATIAFFRTAFLEAPEKMRTTVFGLLYSVNLLTSALIEFKFHLFAIHSSLILIFICLHIILFAVGIFTSYRPIAP